MLTPSEASLECPSRCGLGIHDLDVPCPCSRSTKEFADSLPQVPHYAGTYIGLYALEDKLDQPLCLLGREYNLDVIILRNMVGSHQVVTEVLDTRTREESFKSLIYIVD